MNTEFRACLLAPLLLALTACSVPPARVAPAEEAPLRAMLAYSASSPRPSAELLREPPRERSASSDPYLLMQQAIQLGNARPPELQRATALLEAVLKSAHPYAADLAPLARLLHEQYGERLRLEQHLREAQRRGDLLQEKIDALTAIERSLPARPQPKSSTGGAP